MQIMSFITRCQRHPPRQKPASPEPEAKISVLSRWRAAGTESATASRVSCSDAEMAERVEKAEHLVGRGHLLPPDTA